MLTDARLDIRIKEDITDEVYAIITGSWAHFLSSLKGKRVDKDTSAAIDPAVELWTRRTRAIDAGEIGRSSCRERGCQEVSISVGDGSLKKKTVKNGAPK